MTQPLQVGPIVRPPPRPRSRPRPWSWSGACAAGVFCRAGSGRASAVPSVAVAVHASRITSGRREVSS